MKKIKPSFIPPILWVIISTVLLTLPGSAFPTKDWLGKIWFDKWVHIGMFILMVVLWCWAIHKKYITNAKLKNWFFLIGLFSLFYGIVMELVQHYLIVNRSFEVGDIIADATGCAIGMVYSRWRFIKN
ncbi:MAG: VanZ family protein [Bacteroidota bacterium]